MLMNKLKINLWFVYDIVFSFFLTNTMAFVIIKYINFFKWYWLTIFVAILLICGYYMILFIIHKNRLLDSLKGDLDSADSKLDLNLTYLPVFGFIMSFGLINHQIYLFDNEYFTVDGQIYWIIDSEFDIILYSYDNFIRAACFDLLETYNIHISRLTTNNFWILTLLFAYKTFLSFYFLRYLWTILKGLHKINRV